MYKTRNVSSLRSLRVFLYAVTPALFRGEDVPLLPDIIQLRYHRHQVLHMLLQGRRGGRNWSRVRLMVSPAPSQSYFHILMLCKVIMTESLNHYSRWANGVNVKGVAGFALTEGSFSGSNWKSKLVMTAIKPELAGTIECR